MRINLWQLLFIPLFPLLVIASLLEYILDLFPLKHEHEIVSPKILKLNSSQYLICSGCEKTIGIFKKNKKQTKDRT